MCGSLGSKSGLLAAALPSSSDFVSQISQNIFSLAIFPSPPPGERLKKTSKKKKLKRTTLNGGSLGSCVDEERS